MKNTFLKLIASLLIIGGSAIVHSQTQAGNYPIKVNLESAHKIEAGKTANVKVILVNAENIPAVTESDISVSVNVRWPTGKEAAFTIPIKQGQSMGELSVPMKSPGLCKINAQEAHLLAGNTFIIINPVGTNNPSSSGESGQTKKAIRKAPLMRGGESDKVHPPTEEPPISLPQSANELIIAHSERPLLADGKDSAKIEAFLTLPTVKDLRIRLYNSLGRMLPEVMVIPKDSQYAYVALVSTTAGVADISAPGLTPKPTDVPFKIQFIPPIIGMKCVVSPPNISLIDNTNIMVTLVDEQGRPQRTDTARTIFLAIESGRGEIEKSELTIPAGGFGCQTTLTPTKLGAITLTSTTDALHIEHASLNVTWPVLQLIFSIIGGLAGGFIAKLRQSSDHWRTLIGMITGFVLYWAFIFGLLHVLPHSLALNPFSAFAISVLGGWLGRKYLARYYHNLEFLKSPHKIFTALRGRR